MRVNLVILLFAAVFEWVAPASAADNTLVILMPGGKGAPKQIGFLMRNKHRFSQAGFETVVSSSPPKTIQASRQAKAKGQKVFIVGMSLGVIKSAVALGKGASADGAVFFSGNYSVAKKQLGSSDRLPPTLLVHHRQDQCPNTTPNNVEPFRQWSGGKVKKVVWIDSSGNANGKSPCGPAGAHGFFRKDDKPIAAAVSFIRSN